MFAYLEWSQDESETDNQMNENENEITYLKNLYIFLK